MNKLLKSFFITCVGFVITIIVWCLGWMIFSILEPNAYILICICVLFGVFWAFTYNSMDL